MTFGKTGDRKVVAGDEAPDFTLPSQTGEKVNLKKLLKKGWVVLYFYPKDETPGCTTEACTFRDQYEAFRDEGAEVVGISSDPVESHKTFAARHDLPFLLLSDENGEVRKLYGASSTLGLLPGRVTYVIDREGVVRHYFSSQTNVKGHVENSLRTIRKSRS